MELVMYKGSSVIAFGIVDMLREYNEKEIIQKASYYLAGIQYDKCTDCTFHSEEYYLDIFTEELLASDMNRFYDRMLSDKQIRKRYKYVFVKVRNIENRRFMV